MMMWGRTNKFGARKTVIDGICFDSQKEAMRWCELKIMANAGAIEQLQRQIKFEIIPKTAKFRAHYYIADFVYMENGKKVVEDVKGCRKGIAYQLFRLKQAIMYWRYEIEVKEI